MAELLKAFIEFFADFFAALAELTGNGSSFDDIFGSVSDVTNGLL